jgi:hypothetical protein
VPSASAWTIDHSSLWQVTPDDVDQLLLTHLYRAPDLPAPPRRMSGSEYFPWARNRLQGKEIVSVPDTAKAPPEAARDMAMETRKDSAVEYRVVRPDGSVRWLASYGRRHSRTGGSAFILMGATIEITEPSGSSGNAPAGPAFSSMRRSRSTAELRGNCTTIWGNPSRYAASNCNTLPRQWT